MAKLAAAAVRRCKRCPSLKTRSGEAMRVSYGCHSQTRPVWDCGPNQLGWAYEGSGWGGSPNWQSQTGRVLGLFLWFLAQKKRDRRSSCSFLPASAIDDFFFSHGSCCAMRLGSLENDRPKAVASLVLSSVVGSPSPGARTSNVDRRRVTEDLVSLPPDVQRERNGCLAQIRELVDSKEAIECNRPVNPARATAATGFYLCLPTDVHTTGPPSVFHRRRGARRRLL